MLQSCTFSIKDRKVSYIGLRYNRQNITDRLQTKTFQDIKMGNLQTLCKSAKRTDPAKAAFAIYCLDQFSSSCGPTYHSSIQN